MRRDRSASSSPSTPTGRATARSRGGSRSCEAGAGRRMRCRARTSGSAPPAPRARALRPFLRPRGALREGSLGSVLVEVAVRVLGPLEVVIDGVDVTPPAPKERALLALLVIRRGRVVGADRLMEELWPALRRRPCPRRVLQVRVAAVRKLLGTADAAALLELVAPGYRLAIADEDVDEHQFFELVEQARGRAAARDPAQASAMLREALSLWRGEPLADVQACVRVEAEAARLGEARLGAIEDRIDADLACGRHLAVACELDALVVSHPLRERLWGQRILALYRCGRQAEALRACTVVRDRLHTSSGSSRGRPCARSRRRCWSSAPSSTGRRRRPVPCRTSVRRPVTARVAPAPDHRSGSSRPAPPAIPKIHYAPHGRRHQPRLSGGGRRTARPPHRAGLRLAPRHVVGGAVGSAGATVGVVLAGDPLRQAGDGPVGPAAPRRRRGMGGGHAEWCSTRSVPSRRPCSGSPPAGSSRSSSPRPTPIACVRSCSTARSPGSCGTTTTTRSGSGRRTSTPTSRTPRPDGVPASVSGSTARASSDDPVAREQLGRFQRAVGQPGRRDLLPPGAGPDRRAPRPTDGRRADARPARQAGPCHLRSSSPGTWPSGCRARRWSSSTAPTT